MKVENRPRVSLWEMTRIRRINADFFILCVLCELCGFTGALMAVRLNY